MISLKFPDTIISSLIIISFLLCANIACTSLTEDESRIYSEGMWQPDYPVTQPERTIISSGNGNSRFDVGGILTSVGLKQGASLMGLVVFPLLFPLIALLGIALFIISIFGTGTAAAAAATGRQQGTSNNLPLTLEGYFSDISSPSSNNNMSMFTESPQCIERICCEILVKGRGLASGSKIKRFLKAIGIKPSLLKAVDKSLSEENECNIFKCRPEEFISTVVNENARSSFMNYISSVF